MVALSKFLTSRGITLGGTGGPGFSATQNQPSTPTPTIFQSQPNANLRFIQNVPSNISSGQSTLNIISNLQALTKESSISKTSLFDTQTQIIGQVETNIGNISTLGSNQLSFIDQVKGAFRTVLGPNTNIVGGQDNLNTDPAPGAEPGEKSFVDSAREGFAQIAEQIGPGGIVAGVVVLGVLLFKK